MLEAGKVDLIGTLPQFAQELKDSRKYRVLFTARDAVGPTQAVVWAIHSEVIAAHRPALIDFFEDHIRAVRWFLDSKKPRRDPCHPRGRDEAVEEDVGFAFSKDDFYHSPDARPDVASVQKEIDASGEMGVIPKRIEISPKYVDSSLIEEAKRRIDGE